METLRVRHTIQKSGQVTLRNLPVKKGQQVEVLVLFPFEAASARLTARQLLQSNLIGLWKARDDFNDSAEFARHLRERAQRRLDLTDDPA